MSALPISAIVPNFDNHQSSCMAVRVISTSEEFPVELAWQTASIMARKLRRSGQCVFRDLDDCRQELVSAAWQRWRRYDPAAGSPSTFLRVVMQHAYVSLVRAAMAQKRQPQKDGIVRRSAVHDSDSNTGSVDPERANVEKQLDVMACVARLPVDLRATATLLMRMTIAEVARELGSALYLDLAQDRAVECRGRGLAVRARPQSLLSHGGNHLAGAHGLATLRQELRRRIQGAEAFRFGLLAGLHGGRFGRDLLRRLRLGAFTTLRGWCSLGVLLRLALLAHRSSPYKCSWPRPHGVATTISYLCLQEEGRKTRQIIHQFVAIWTRVSLFGPRDHEVG